MWSLGAVLYHILSGIPPYSGRAEDRGVAMLRSIMTSEADFNILRQCGVSEDGVDFVSKLLNRDAFARPTEKECFQHPWIVDVLDVDEYEDDDLLADPRDGLSVIGEADEELDASQLSIHDEAAYLHEAQDEVGSSEALAKKPRIEYIPADIRYPSLPQIESFQDSQVVAEHHARRLFGEVTSSALRSSQAMGHTGAWDHDSNVKNSVSSGESMSDEYSVSSVVSLPAHPFGGTAPSLMGAENLVGRLNMNSSHPVLHPQTASVNEISTPQVNPGQPKDLTSAGSPPEIAKSSYLGAQDTTPKAPKLKISRRLDFDLPETASEQSSDTSAQTSRRGSTQPPELASHENLDIELMTTLDAQTGQAILDQQLNADIEASEPIVHQPDPPSVPPSISSNEFTKPPKILGRLKSVRGSIFELNLRLENRMTSWGRGPAATIRHEDRMDTRIPAYALEITFWAPGIEVMIAEGKDWQQVPGVRALLSTKTRKCIWVNGTELRRGTSNDGGMEGLHFGEIYSGDIITVYRHKGEFLDLRCEFYHGDSAQQRPAHEAGFVVRKALANKPDSAGNRLPLRTQKKQAM
jgi:hypothetical protein